MADAAGVPEPRPTPPTAPSGARPPVREVDLDWRSVLTALGAFVTLLALTGLVRSAPRSVTAVAVGSLLALALNPLVSAVQRQLSGRRGVAVGLVLVGFGAAVALLLLVLTPPAVREARDLQDDLPRVVDQLGQLPVVGHRLEKADAPAKVRRWVEELPDRLQGDTTPIQRAGRLVFDGVLTAFLTVLVAVSLLVDGERLLRGLRRMVPPLHRARADRLADLAYRVVGRYVAGSVLVAGIAGVAVLIAGLVLRVPLTPLLAVWVAIFDLVPQIGGAAGGIPFVALGFTRSPGTGVACAVFFLLYLQFENHVLQPIVVGQAVRLSPPATMTAALVGVSAAGVMGALIAVPLVGAAKVIYVELRSSPPPAPPPEIVSAPDSRRS